MRGWADICRRGGGHLVLFSRPMAADPKFSAGARLERRAFRNYLKRKLVGGYNPIIQIGDALDWVKKRQARYDRKAGGLGK